MKNWIIICFCTFTLMACGQPPAGQESATKTVAAGSSELAKIMKEIPSFSATEKQVGDVSFKELEFKPGEGGQQLAYKDGKLFTGNAINFYPNSEKKYLSQAYAGGKKEGEWMMWFENGNMQKYGQVKDGKENGPSYSWYPTGEVKYAQYYKGGLKDGVWLSFYESGVKWTSRDFYMGNLDGKVLVWDSLGVLGKEYFYKDGQLMDQIMHFEKNKAKEQDKP